MDKKAWEKEVQEKMKKLEEFINGPYVSMHEYKPGDAEFANRLEELNTIVSELYKATFK